MPAVKPLATRSGGKAIGDDWKGGGAIPRKARPFGTKNAEPNYR
jgi:hypothetical protein